MTIMSFAALEGGSHQQSLHPGAQRDAGALTRGGEEVWPRAGLESSEWVELQIRLALQGQSSAEEVLARGLHRLLSGHAQEVWGWAVQNPVFRASVDIHSWLSRVHRSFSEIGSS